MENSCLEKLAGITSTPKKAEVNRPVEMASMPLCSA